MMVWLVDMKILRRSDYLHDIIRHFTNFGSPIFIKMIKNHFNLPPFRTDEAGDAMVDGLIERIFPNTRGKACPRLGGAQING
jgi:hypothetical protein